MVWNILIAWHVSLSLYIVVMQYKQRSMLADEWLEETAEPAPPKSNGPESAACYPCYSSNTYQTRFLQVQSGQ